MILEPRKIMSATVSTVSPSICYEVMGLNAMILVFCVEKDKTIKIQASLAKTIRKMMAVL